MVGGSHSGLDGASTIMLGLNVVLRFCGEPQCSDMSSKVGAKGGKVLEISHIDAGYLRNILVTSFIVVFFPSSVERRKLLN